MNNENFELVGIIGEQRYPVYCQIEDQGQVNQYKSGPKTIPVLFKDLPLGTRLYLKVEDEQRVKKTLQTIRS